MATKGLPILLGRVIIRGDDGPTGELGPVKEFLQLAPGQYIDVDFLKSVPPFNANQIEFTKNDTA